MSQRESAGDHRSEQRGAESHQQAHRAEQRGRAESKRQANRAEQHGQAKSQRQANRAEQRGQAKNQQQANRAEQRNRQQDRTTGQGAARENARDQSRQATTQNQQRQQSQHEQRQQSQSTTGSAQGQAAATAQSGRTLNGRTLSSQQQANTRSSVLSARNAPRVSANNINFGVNVGASVPRSVHVVSVSTFPELIDVFPQYRSDSFFIVGDEIVFLDDEREVVDVVALGPRTRFSGRGPGSSRMAMVNLPRDEIVEVQRVLIDRGFLTGSPDGAWGPRSRQALIAFQRREGIAVTGGIDTRTVSELGLSGRVQAQGAAGSSASITGQGGAQTTGQGGAQQPAARDNRRNTNGASADQRGAAQQRPSAADRGTNARETTGQGSSNQGAKQPEAQSGNRKGSASGTTGQGLSHGNAASKRHPAQPESNTNQPSR